MAGFPKIYTQNFSEVHFASGYLNATAMCKANGKKFNHWSSNQDAKEKIEAISSVTGIPGTELIQTNQGGRPHEQGTWVHPHVAILDAKTFSFSPCF